MMSHFSTCSWESVKIDKNKEETNKVVIGIVVVEEQTEAVLVDDRVQASDVEVVALIGILGLFRRRIASSGSSFD